MYSSEMTRLIALIVMLPLMLALKLVIVIARMTAAFFRFIIGIGQSCVEVLKEVRYF